MKQTFEVRVIGEPRSGVSAANGKAWRNQDLVLAWKERLQDGREVENITIASLHGEGVERFATLGIKEGGLLQADIAFGTRSYNGKVYCENRLFI